MILMNDFKAEPAELREAMFAAVRRVLESGWYVLGEEVSTFEKRWASICGVGFGVGVGNGMDAIELALRGLDIGPGDEVITTPMTAFATVLAILRAGAMPVLADIEPGTALLSLDSVKRCLGPKTKAVVLVHLYGQARQLDVWQAFCNENGIHLIEDCAQSHLAACKTKVAGSFGVAGCYSFYPTKNLGAPGDAGMFVTEDEALAERVSRLRNYGQSVRYHHPELGMNSRLDELQAAILGERLDWLERFTTRRQEVASAYFDGIRNSKIELLEKPIERSNHVYHLFVVKSAERERLSQHLQAAGIASLAHYPVPIHKQVPCKNLKRDPRGLLNAEAHADSCLSIPCHPQMSADDVLKVIDNMNSYKGS